MEVRPSDAEDRPSLEAFLRGRTRCRSRPGRVVDSLDHPAFLAEEGDQLIGVATYVVGDGEWELLTLHSERRYAGVGSALVAAVREAAMRAGVGRRGW